MLSAFSFAALVAISGGFVPFARAQTAALDVLPPELNAKLSQINWTSELTEKFISGLPKVETHVHLDGTLSVATIMDLAKRQNYAPLLARSGREIAKMAVVKDSRASLGDVLKAFETFYPLLRTPEAVEEMAYNFIASEKAQNIQYAEPRFAPALQATPNFSMEQVLLASLRGLQRGKEKFGVGSGVIICLIRTLPREQNEEMFQLVVKYFGRGVVGVDLAGDEAEHPLSEFEGFFRRAKDLGIPVTVHAGEVPGSSDLQLALKLGADRIGHGTMLVKDPEMMKELAKRKTAVEINLTSNVRTGAIRNYKEHPARIFFDAGIPISLSTDDPGVFGIDLAHEYRILINELHFTVPELVATIFQSIDSLFATPEQKSVLKKQFLGDIGSLADRIRRESGQ